MSSRILKKTQQGFTLIELMSVVVLMMLVISLVAPLGIKMVEKAQAQTEYIQLQSFLKKRSQEAFLSSKEVRIEITTNSLRYWQNNPNNPNNQSKKEKIFKHLVFNTGVSTFSFNRNGLPSLLSLDVQVGSQSLTYDLGNLWGKRNE